MHAFSQNSPSNSSFLVSAAVPRCAPTATSSVDAKTDQEVQDTIRREFVNRGVSVITVAHRLDTVMGYDKIAVLGDGRVLEYGVPNDLLKIPKGELRRLVEADRSNKRKGAKRSKEAALAL